jgi:mannose-1-phosphate guanylyltransferase
VVAKAAILCGGEGTRLRPLSNYFQKTMIPIGPKRRPLLEYIVRLMVHNGVPDLVLLCGYRAEQIENYFGGGERFGARIAYSRDQRNVKGSAQALMHAIESGNVGEFDELVVYYGDVLSALDVAGLLRERQATNAAAALVLSKEYDVPVGVAEIEDGQVVKLREKPNLNLSVTTGSLVLSKECVPVLKECTSGGGVDIMTHFVPQVIQRHMKVVPFYLKGFWYDVGTTEAYEKLDQMKLDASLSFLG